MRDYYTCTKCGANLDHGERCDCTKPQTPKWYVEVVNQKGELTCTHKDGDALTVINHYNSIGSELMMMERIA